MALSSYEYSNGNGIQCLPNRTRTRTVADEKEHQAYKNTGTKFEGLLGVNAACVAISNDRTILYGKNLHGQSRKGAGRLYRLASREFRPTGLIFSTGRRLLTQRTAHHRVLVPRLYRLLSSYLTNRSGMDVLRCCNGPFEHYATMKNKYRMRYHLVHRTQE